MKLAVKCGMCMAEVSRLVRGSTKAEIIQRETCAILSMILYKIDVCDWKQEIRFVPQQLVTVRVFTAVRTSTPPESLSLMY